MVFTFPTDKGHTLTPRTGFWRTRTYRNILLLLHSLDCLQIGRTCDLDSWKPLNEADHLRIELKAERERRRELESQLAWLRADTEERSGEYLDEFSVSVLDRV